MTTLTDLWARVAHLTLWWQDRETEDALERRQRELRRRLDSLVAEERLWRNDVHRGGQGEIHGRDR